MLSHCRPRAINVNDSPANLSCALPPSILCNLLHHVCGVAICPLSVVSFLILMLFYTQLGKSRRCMVCTRNLCTRYIDAHGVQPATVPAPAADFEVEEAGGEDLVVFIAALSAGAVAFKLDNAGNIYLL